MTINVKAVKCITANSFQRINNIKNTANGIINVVKNNPPLKTALATAGSAAWILKDREVREAKSLFDMQTLLSKQTASKALFASFVPKITRDFTKHINMINFLQQNGLTQDVLEGLNSLFKFKSYGLCVVELLLTIGTVDIILRTKNKIAQKRKQENKTNSEKQAA